MNAGLPLAAVVRHIYRPAAASVLTSTDRRFSGGPCLTSLTSILGGRASDKIGREEVLARAQSLVPVLAERSEACEKMRRAPDETVRDYVDHGLLRVCQPGRYGGYDLGYDVLCEVVQTLARGCGSQAWVYMVLADNPLKLAAYDLKAQDDVWGEDTTKKLCVAVSAVGRATEVEGGVVWNGVHGFSSGIDHADWVMCGGFVYDEQGNKGRGMMVLMPTSEVTIIDDWHVVGLAGTGSKSFEVRNVFIPTHRILDKAQNDAGQSPGMLFYDAPVMKLPRGGVSAVSYTAAVVGIAQGFLQNFYEITSPRKSRGNSVADQPGIQMSVGLAAAEIEAAERMYLGAIRETMAALARDGKVSQEMHYQGKRNACYAAQLSLNAVQRLFNIAGGRALMNEGVLQRQFRDCFAAAAHHSLVWESAAIDYGRHALRAQ
jgi:3-hydroxy-9,10-secoandrosta-1,3,5(10)-triene-9,17-dione monooxygenase